MSFNKRYIHKDRILNNLNNLSYIRNLVNADALIMDDWSKKFFDNFDFSLDYQKVRKSIVKDTILYSDNNKIKEHIDFNKLKKLSNILCNLKSDPNWVDIELAYSIVNKPTDNLVKFEYIVNDVIDKITNIYETSNTKKI